MKISRLTTLALFTTIALILSLVETALPPLAPIPGIKLGLANVVTLLLLYLAAPQNALFVLLARILLASLFAGQAMSLLYSLTGGIFCFLAMWLCKYFLNKKYIVLTSMVGGIFHNAGQILVAYLLTQTTGVLLYFPILLISGLIAGAFTGLCAHYARKYLARLCQF